MKNLKIQMISALLALVVSLTPHATASELSFRISNDSIGGGLESNISESDLFAGFEHLYKDKDDAINISNINLHTKGQTVAGNMPTTVMIGLEATHMKEGAFKGSAIAFGGNIRLNIPAAPGLSFETRLHYAPDIVAYGDSDRFTRARAQLNYRVIKSADISAGYQYLNTGIKGGKDRTFESGLYLGLKLVF